MINAMLYILMVIVPAVGATQSILDHFEIEYGAWNDSYDYMVEAPSGNFVIGLINSTKAEGMVVGDTTVYAYRIDTIHTAGLDITDFYLLKFNSSYHLLASFVIDNAEQVRDYAVGEEFSLVSFTLNQANEHDDSMYPILLAGDQMIEREGRRGQGVLIVMDSDLNYHKHLYISTGQLGQVAVKNQYAYLEIRMPSDSNFITVSSDTIYNYTYNIGGVDVVGFQTVVLCKYDLQADTIVWTRRIGGPGMEELWDLEIATNGDLVVLGITSSVQFQFSEEEFIENYEVDKPFLARYNTHGEFLWGKLNTSQPGEWFHNLVLDEVGNVYIQGSTFALEYHIADTVLFNPMHNGWIPDKGLIVKYDNNGGFTWASILQGSCKFSNLLDLDITPSQEVIVSGYFWEGSLIFGSDEYHDLGPGAPYQSFLWQIDENTGKYLGHIMTNGPSHRWFWDVIVDDQGNINTYLLLTGKDTILGTELSSVMGFRSGFILKISPDFPLSIVSPLANQDFAHVSPNPIAQGNSVTLSLSPEVANENLECRLYSNTGILVYSRAYPGVQSTISFEIPPLASGQYWIAVNTMDKIDVSPLVIE